MSAPRPRPVAVPMQVPVETVGARSRVLVPELVVFGLLAAAVGVVVLTVAG